MILVAVSGMDCLTRLPANSEIAKIALHKKPMIRIERIGILIRLVPYAKHATKASTDRAITNSKDSIMEKITWFNQATTYLDFTNILYRSKSFGEFYLKKPFYI